MPVITIARQYGAGGSTVAAIVAERLGADLVDKWLDPRLWPLLRDPCYPVPRPLWRPRHGTLANPCRARSGASVMGLWPTLAAPALAPDFPASDQPFPRQGGNWGARTVLAAVALGLAVVGGIAVRVGMSRMPSRPLPAPAQPTRVGSPRDPWGGRPGPTW
jgi:hypothetical protein